MLQVNYIRQNRDEVLQRLAVRNFAETGLVDAVISLDDERKKLQSEFDNIQSKVNSVSKEIGSKMKLGQRDVAEAMKAEVADLKVTIEPLKEQMAEVEKQLHDALVLLPNCRTK